MNRHHLHIAVIVPPVGLLVFEAHVGEVDLIIEVGKVVLARPLLDLVLVAIGAPIAVAAIPVALVQPGLILTLEFVVEDDSPDACAALLKALRFTFVGAIDLDVVLQFPFAFGAGVEALATISVAVAVALEQAPALLRQRDGVVPRAGYPNRLNETLFTEVPQISRSRIDRMIAVVPQIATGDDPKRADGGKGPRFRTAQGVLAITIANDFPFPTARQIHVARERVSRVGVALTAVAFAFRPTGIVTAVAPVLVSVLSIAAWTTTERPSVVILTLARSNLRLARVVFPVAVIRTAAAASVGPVPLVVARIEVARIEVKHGDLQTNRFP
jgi:hypothetical protein